MQRIRSSIQMAPAVIDQIKELRKSYQDFVKSEDARFARETNHDKLYAEWGSGTRYRQELDRLKTEHQERINKARADFQKSLVETVTPLQDQIYAEVQNMVIAPNISAFLASGITLDKTELDVLAENYGNQYWTSRAIAELAERSGVAMQNLPSAQTQLSAIEELLHEADVFISDSRDAEIDNAISHLTLRQLSRAEQAITGGLNTYTPQQLSLRATEEVRRAGYGITERGLKIANIVRNFQQSNEHEALHYFLAAIAEDQTIDHSVLSFCSEEARHLIAQYRNGKQVYAKKHDDDKSQDKPLSEADQAVASALSAKVAEMKAAERVETSAE